MTIRARRFFIVTPVLNGAAHLPAALESINSQSLSSWTHYVVDGGSSDDTIKIVRQTMENEPRRKLIQGKDRGLYDALFKGFEAAKADGLNDDDICLWLNADDYLAPWALATMKLAFDIWDANWLTGQPGQWDAEGRLVLVKPVGWYPRWCIAHGWFNGNCLGWIQQESTFFTGRMLSNLDPATVETIRGTRMAGDFLLWRAFATVSALQTVPSLIGGFRAHGANLSLQGERYLEELRQHRAFLPPAPLGKILRALYMPLAVLCAANQARQPLQEARLPR